MTRVVIAAGGTAGHLYPGLAVAQVLRKAGAEVLFVGRKDGAEEQVVSGQDFGFEGIKIIGRGPGLVGWRNLKAAFLLVPATAKCFQIFGSFRPDVVLGTGGYVSLPAALAARMRRVPLVIHEQNAVPGLANRIAGRFAARAAVGFPGTEHHFGAGAVLTGTPVRPEILNSAHSVGRAEAREHFGLDPGRKTLLVFGGSQGALHINGAAVAAYEHWRRLPMQVLHLTGRGKSTEVASAIESSREQGDSLPWRVFEYSDRMELAYAASELAVCRSGASTVAELSATGLPAVLIPLPVSLDDDQRENAKVACEAGGAKMLADAELNSGPLGPLVAEMLMDEKMLASMSRAIRGLARPDAAERLAALVVAEARVA